MECILTPIRTLRFYLGLLLVLGVNYSLFAQNNNLKIVDCQTGESLPGVYVVDAGNHILGKSNAGGLCHFTATQWPIFLKRYGYQTSGIYEPSALKKVICLKPLSDTLSTVTVKAKKGNIKKYLLKLRDKNLPLFLNHDTTIYYHFKYHLQFPQKNWQEEATGYVAYYWQKHNHKRLAEVYYTQYDYSCTDTTFWHSRFYKTLQPLGVFHGLRYDIMGSSRGYQIWNKLVNRQGFTFIIPIPKFLLSRKKREALKKINKHPEKYHLKQHLGSNHRRLTLSLDSLKNQIFSAHFSNALLTKGYVSEKIIFDSLKRLKTVYYYSPEGLPKDFFSLDTLTLNKMATRSKINNDSSYYYSRYSYDVQHKPILLKQVKHLGKFYVAGTPYQVTLTINLMNKRPSKDFEVSADRWVGGRHSGHYIGLGKGENVLKAMKKQGIK